MNKYIMDFKIYSDKEVNFLSFKSLYNWLLFFGIVAFSVLLNFFVFKFSDFNLHFFQIGIFTASFLFGPLAGGLIGAVSSSYSGLFVLHNPWILGGNFILGYFTALFYKKFGFFCVYVT